jgi:predicted DNA-binding protein (MmcQ/YjbR family)
MVLSRREYNAFCGGLPGASFVEQWGGAQVWKVGGPAGKVFAIAWYERGHEPGITFKVSDIGWEVLCGAPGCRPAPYMASRGLKWIQSYAQPGLSKAELKKYLAASHAMAAKGLPKRVRRELGFDGEADG